MVWSLFISSADTVSTELPPWSALCFTDQYTNQELEGKHYALIEKGKKQPLVYGSCKHYICFVDILFTSMSESSHNSCFKVSHLPCLN